MKSALSATGFHNTPRMASSRMIGEKHEPLVVIGYDDEFKAEEFRLTLRKLQKDY
jgi:hypothetical protein